MKLCFLDIDGVVVTRATLMAAHAARQGNRITSTLLFDDDVLRRLRVLQDATGCQFIVSSTWRRSTPWPSIRKRFGLDIIGQTPVRGGRGEEIADVVGLHNPERYLILDDDVFDMLPEQEPYIVQTSMETGFTETHLQAGLAVLGYKFEALKAAREKHVCVMESSATSMENSPLSPPSSSPTPRSSPGATA